MTEKMDKIDTPAARALAREAAPAQVPEDVERVADGECRYCANTGWFYSDPELGACGACEVGALRNEVSDLKAQIARLKAPVTGDRVELLERLRLTTERMACTASVDMTLWNEHSNAALQAAAMLEADARLLAAKDAEIAGLRAVMHQAKVLIGAQNDTAHPAVKEANINQAWHLLDKPATPAPDMAALRAKVEAGDMGAVFNALHKALPQRALSYALHMCHHGGTVHFVATDADHNLIDVYGYGGDLEEAWADACKATLPCDHEMVEGHGGPIMCQHCLKTDAEIAREEAALIDEAGGGR